MSWNHRAMRHAGEPYQIWYGIHEVYYNDKGEVTTWTENHMAPYGETPEELKEELERMLRALNHPILEYPE